MTLSTDEPEILQGDKATFELEGKYFFGGPVSDAAAEYSAYPAPYRFQLRRRRAIPLQRGRPYWDGYGRRTEKRIVAEGSLQTDADGVAKFDLVGDLGDEPGSQRWRVEASIRDEAGQTITADSDLVVHQGLLYIGARPEKYVTRVGDDSVIKIIAVDWESQPIADQDIDVQVMERRWTRQSRARSLTTGRVISTWDVEEIPVSSGPCDHRTPTAKRASSYQPPKGGSYSITVSTRDELGNKVEATTHVPGCRARSTFAGGAGDDKTIELAPARKITASAIQRRC